MSINAMIDAACGVTPAMRAQWEAERRTREAELAAAEGHDADDVWLILWCPFCDRLQAQEHQDDDPPSATLCELPCCRDFRPARYFDASGAPLLVRLGAR